MLFLIDHPYGADSAEVTLPEELNDHTYKAITALPEVWFIDKGCGNNHEVFFTFHVYRRFGISKKALRKALEDLLSNLY